MRTPLAVAKGSLDVFVLRALSLAPMHGFEIVAWIEQRSGGSLELNDAAVYQALYRMDARGLVQATTGLTENNRRARYYQLTTAGKQHLRVETQHWVTYAAMVTDFLTGPLDPSADR